MAPYESNICGSVALNQVALSLRLHNFDEVGLLQQIHNRQNKYWKTQNQTQRWSAAAPERLTWLVMQQARICKHKATAFATSLPLGFGNTHKSLSASTLTTLSYRAKRCLHYSVRQILGCASVWLDLFVSAQIGNGRGCLILLKVCWNVCIVLSLTNLLIEQIFPRAEEEVQHRKVLTDYNDAHKVCIEWVQIIDHFARPYVWVRALSCFIARSTDSHDSRTSKTTFQILFQV